MAEAVQEIKKAVIYFGCEGYVVYDHPSGLSRIIQSNNYFSLFIMLTSGRHLPRSLGCCGLVSYSTKVNKYDPRTTEVKKFLVPWRYRNENKSSNFFRLIEPFTSTTDILKFLQTPFDFRKTKINSWLTKKRYLRDTERQAYSRERQEALGDEISVGHVVLPLGGAIRYKGKPWMKYDLKGDDFTELPETFEEGWLLEAIDVSNCDIRFEGFENFRNLNNVNTLTAQKCPYLDDWCLDLICCELLGLENLDLTGCLNLTPRGLVALTRLPNLHSLNLSDIPAFDSHEGQLMCLLLQDVNERLSIKGVNFPALPKDVNCDDATSVRKGNSSLSM